MTPGFEHNAQVGDRADRETRVGMLEHIAEASGISKETARTHLRRIYSKTATHRQAELVSLILTGPAVLRR